ncbi:MAG TPA: SRPBCC family protein, partial [Sandaracinaceae bacterium]
MGLRGGRDAAGHVPRRTEPRVAAAPDRILPHLTDLRKWSEWNPWRDLDPSLRLTYSDPASGEGAWYAWEGNDDAGKGRMEITTVGDRAVRYRLVFVEPFPSESDVE